jgi:hypothetical protein
MVPTPGSSWTERRYVAALARVRLNYALERPAKGPGDLEVNDFMTLPHPRPG